MIFTILALPLGSLIFLRLYENLLIHQTEGELIGQSAALASLLASESEGLLQGTPATAIETGQMGDDTGRYTPIQPTLDLAFEKLFGRRPDAAPGRELSDREREVGAKLADVLSDTQRVTLAGFRILAADGTVIAGREEVGDSLAHISEVASALDGRFVSLLRDRYSEQPAPALASLSRSAKVRLFVAMPVISDGHVVGVVYASRTPKNILKDLYIQRERVFWAAIVIVFGAAMIGYIFVRTVARPIRQLKEHAEEVARDPLALPAPLDHYGSQEVKSLADSFTHMAKALSEQSNYVRTFAAHVSHELKSPLTSIVGASEMLQDEMSDADRKRFLQTIRNEAHRMSRLLERLRDLAKAEAANAKGACEVDDVLGRIKEAYPLSVDRKGVNALRVALPEEDLFAVLAHLADNSVKHGAARLVIEASDDEKACRLSVCDDGSGIAPSDRQKIFDAFYTTRREEGGTGMGLGIARALIRAHGGELELGDAPSGACFVLSLPKQSD